MPTYKTTFIFNQGRYGWSETWYQTQVSAGIALAIGINVATRRAALLGNGPKLEYIRVSDVSIPGDSTVSAINADAHNDPAAADTPWNAVYARFNAGDLYRRQMWLRGIPDSWIVLTGGNPNVNPIHADLSSAFSIFKNYVILQGWQLKTIKKDGPGGVETNVTGLSADAEGRLRFAVAGGIGLVNDEIRISKFTGPDAKALNRVWKIVANDGVNITVPFMFGDLLSPFLDAGGKMKPRIVEYNLITSASIMRASKRSTGRAFFVSAGRRKKAC